MITTISMTKAHTTKRIIKYIKKWRTFRELKPDVPLFTHNATYTFTPKRGENDPEMRVTSSATRTPSIFSTIQKHRTKTPVFLYQQIYQIQETRLKLYEARYLSTPFYILNKFLKALRSGKRFTAYKYITYRKSFPAFKKLVKKKLSDLYDKTLPGNWI